MSKEKHLFWNAIWFLASIAAAALTARLVDIRAYGPAAGVGLVCVICALRNLAHDIAISAIEAGETRGRGEGAA